MMELYFKNVLIGNIRKVVLCNTYEKLAQLVLATGSDTGVFLWILRNFKNTFFTEHFRSTASEDTKSQEWLFVKKKIQVQIQRLTEINPLQPGVASLHPLKT